MSSKQIMNESTQAEGQLKQNSRQPPWDTYNVHDSTLP